MSEGVASEIRVYRASTMREALRLVREELGPAAMIVRVEPVRKKSWFGKPRIEGVEVQAQGQPLAPARIEMPQPANLIQGAAGSASAPHAAKVRVNSKSNSPRALAEPAARADSVRSLPSRSAEERDSRRTLAGALARAEFPADAIEDELDELFASLSPDDSRRAEDLLPILARRFAGRLRTERGALPAPASALRIALVGATGVGKTTTVAKLAARYAIDNKLRVGLIGVDTYRLGAVDQLEQYASLLKAPLRVATSPETMRRAVRELADRDVILVDTAGRSPLDADGVGDLAGILDAGEIDHVWLTVSASSHVGAYATASARFAPLAPTGLVLTKLDEQTACGHLWPALSTTELPTYYLADGQRVPEDLAPADARRLARALIGASNAERRPASMRVAA